MELKTVRPLVSTTEEGRFSFAKSTRIDEGYDVFFTANGRKALVYVASFSEKSVEGMEYLCSLFEEIHNGAIQEQEKKREKRKKYNEVYEVVLTDIIQDLRDAELNPDKGFKEIVDGKLEEKRSQIEEILERPMDQDDKDEFISHIEDILWF